MDFKPVSKHWNRVDTLIYKVERITHHLIEQWNESKEPEPDVEEIIAAETQYLKSENEKYKKMLYPLDLVIRDGRRYCPSCDTKIDEGYEGKCCCECGQRIKRDTIDNTSN